MKSSVRLSPPVTVAVLAAAFFIFAYFVVNWHRQQNELSHLASEEKSLKADIEQLKVLGDWTVDYVKINKAVDHLANKRLSAEARQKLTEQIWQISHSYSIDPILILAVVAQESRGNPMARGRFRSGAASGAMGLMQVKLPTAQAMARKFGLSVNTLEDLFKPEINVAVGTAYLITLIGKYGNWKDALVAYNLGHGAVDNLLRKGRPLPLRYYQHVISKYRVLTNLSFF